MAVQFPAPSTAAERWGRRASAAAPDYEAGAKAATGKWQPAAVAAQPNYEQGVTAAIAKKAFATGIQRAGDAKWLNRTTTVGPARFSQGVMVAQPAYDAAVAPIWAKAAATVLGARGPRRSEGNYQRSVQMAKAFAAAKS